MAFVAVGLATALCYVALVLWAPLLPTNLYMPLLDLGKITGYRGGRRLTTCALVRRPVRAVRASATAWPARGKASTTQIFVGGALCAR